MFQPLNVRDLTLSSTVRLTAQDRARIQDAWERQDCAADRGEDAGEYSWETYDRLVVRVDPAGDIWFDDALVAWRDQDVAVCCAPGMERVLVY